MNGDVAELYARFDSLAPGGSSFVFSDPAGLAAAWTIDEVAGALRQIETAIATGLHAAGFIAYEAAPALDPALETYPPRPGLPLLWFGLYRRKDEIRPLEGVVSPPGEGERAEIGRWSPALRPDEYGRRVEQIRERIAAGDTYQVNLTFRLAAEHTGETGQLYADLCRSQRAGYCAWIRGPFGSVLSASPELFFRWSGDELEMRPMKGTRPRGRRSVEDRLLERELLESAKERAENLMIVDLLRNDAGRVAEFGSVSVPALFDVERFPTVLQLTSTVRATTVAGTTLTDIFRALFPSGSVTGAPKVSTMKIIRKMEDGPRGVYTGAIGFASAGDAVFNVPIRTLLSTDDRRLEMGVGSGITFDSDPAAEYAECMQKAGFAHHRVPEMELLETMRYDPGIGFHLLEGHLTRLTSSAEYFRYPVDREALLDALDAAVKPAASTSPSGPLMVRLRLGSDGGVRVGTRPVEHRRGLHARIASDPVDSRDPLLYHKTTARAMYEQRLADHPGYDEVLLINERGEPTEFTTGNLVAVLDGLAFTPPVECGLLPGVEREAMLTAGEITERVLTVADLARADAVYLVNSVRHRVPVDLET